VSRSDVQGGHRVRTSEAELSPPRTRSRDAGTTVFRAATAVVALAVADDAFVHPEQGVDAADHLASGLIPLLAAAGLAWSYPRMRAGLRGAVALGAGVLAIAAGIADGIRHVAVDRLTGDDLLVSLGGVAGLVLVALGIATLWQSRRRDGTRLRRYARRAALAALAGVAALYVLVPAVVAVVATHRAREPVAAVDLGRPHEQVAFTTADGLRLRGWYVPSRNGAAVVLSPGRRGPVAHARMLVRHGFGVLLFDRRGEGESDGDFNAYGWEGARDLDAALGFLAGRPDVEPGRLGGLGLSVGGEMLLEAAAADPRLRAVVSEGGSVRSIAEHWDDPGIAALLKPFTPLAMQTASVAVLSNAAPPPSLLDLVGEISGPVMFIRGLDGQPAEALNREFHRVAREPKVLWEIPAARHTAGLAAAPAEYERRVVNFFTRSLLGRT
jgi:predicted alpha/beta hydrolase